MKYTTRIDIEKPIKAVVALFDNTENYKYWMDGLELYEILEGSQGKVGTKSKLKFNTGNRKIEMTETIVTSNLPDEYIVTYEAPGVFNVVKNHFEPISDGKTLYLTEHEFKFTGFMRILAFFLRGAFKKQSRKYLLDFKKFVESQS